MIGIVRNNLPQKPQHMDLNSWHAKPVWNRLLITDIIFDTLEYQCMKRTTHGETMMLWLIVQPDAKLHKRHNILSFHFVRSLIACGFINLQHIKSESNIGDILKKHWGYQSTYKLIRPVNCNITPSELGAYQNINTKGASLCTFWSGKNFLQS